MHKPIIKYCVSNTNKCHIAMCGDFYLIYNGCEWRDTTTNFSWREPGSIEYQDSILDLSCVQFDRYWEPDIINNHYNYVHIFQYGSDWKNIILTFGRNFYEWNNDLGFWEKGVPGGISIQTHSHLGILKVRENES